jgi:hypothetical protein
MFTEKKFAVKDMSINYAEGPEKRSATCDVTWGDKSLANVDVCVAALGLALLLLCP